MNRFSEHATIFRFFLLKRNDTLEIRKMCHKLHLNYIKPKSQIKTHVGNIQEQQPRESNKNTTESTDTCPDFLKMNIYSERQ